MDKESIKKVLCDNGYKIKSEHRFKNQGYTLKTEQGSSVICFDSGKIKVDGKMKKPISALLKSKRQEWDFPNDKIFIVYGHDNLAKTELENLLRQLGLQPVSIDNLPTEGNTIIEQLEKYIPNTNYGIVLMTPDDIGYDKNTPEHLKYRARQNVIFEAGLLFSKLSRSKVMIIEKKVDRNSLLEMPSDLNGILVKRYDEHIDEVKNQIVRELSNKGYKID